MYCINRKDQDKTQTGSESQTGELKTTTQSLLHVLHKQKGLRQDTQTGSESQTGGLKSTTQSLLHVLHKQKGLRQAKLED